MKDLIAAEPFPSLPLSLPVSSFPCGVVMSLSVWISKWLHGADEMYWICNMDKK